ncbi:hypothetical protein M3J09_003409 [Ascochyta lentis]
MPTCQLIPLSLVAALEISSYRMN